MMDDGDQDLHRLDQALLGLRRFFAAPPAVLDGNHPVELSTLLVLDAVVGVGGGAATVRRVAEHLDVTASTASRLVERAAAVGAVVKVRGEHDARQVVLHPTPDGVALAERATAYRHARLEALLEGWSERDRHELARSLERFATAARGGGAAASDGEGRV
ncbi:MarR family winged helix-turn-helix transcriptional regulator [Actinotalea sp. K2]|uniref:MarR family winged helix-turn-helix transcriptional regulator n=1 Tax=Actinotalea sp. K2 TaxID=2939438 RepID=UPI0020175C67|nr:MarR family winged helix-turn-helix transcriptional regulator [Actinotalea sp. K2]MCL3862876.1 MarR family winged helix-turn-helix transcriptional regulator [Actinotalea sp. K2]